MNREVVLETIELSSPLGRLTAVVRSRVLCALQFTDCFARTARGLRRRFGDVPLRSARDGGAIARPLDRYFAGELAALDELEVDPGGTPFQSRVWVALRRVRPGSTVSYSDLAAAVGVPAAVRAVGAANGANPVCLVVPCHRAIGADGTLTGYAGGLARKQWLLAHERVELDFSRAARR